MPDVLIKPEGVLIHDAKDCKGRRCTIHNPSHHGMETWPIIIRMDRGALAERECVHGVGHPDPDSLKWFAKRYDLTDQDEYYTGVHGCDGCCGRALHGLGRVPSPPDDRDLKLKAAFAEDFPTWRDKESG